MKIQQTTPLPDLDEATHGASKVTHFTLYSELEGSFGVYPSCSRTKTRRHTGPVTNYCLFECVILRDFKERKLTL